MKQLLDHVVIDANGLITWDIVGSCVIDANGLIDWCPWLMSSNWLIDDGWTIYMYCLWWEWYMSKWKPIDKDGSLIWCINEDGSLIKMDHWYDA